MNSYKLSGESFEIKINRLRSRVNIFLLHINELLGSKSEKFQDYKNIIRQAVKKTLDILKALDVAIDDDNVSFADVQKAFALALTLEVESINIERLMYKYKVMYAESFAIIAHLKNIVDRSDKVTASFNSKKKQSDMLMQQVKALEYEKKELKMQLESSENRKDIEKRIKAITIRISSLTYQARKINNDAFDLIMKFNSKARRSLLEVNDEFQKGKLKDEMGYGSWIMETISQSNLMSLSDRDLRKLHSGVFEVKGVLGVETIEEVINIISMFISELEELISPDPQKVFDQFIEALEDEIGRKSFFFKSTKSISPSLKIKINQLRPLREGYHEIKVSKREVQSAFPDGYTFLTKHNLLPKDTKYYLTNENDIAYITQDNEGIRVYFSETAIGHDEVLVHEIGHYHEFTNHRVRKAVSIYRQSVQKPLPLAYLVLIRDKPTTLLLHQFPNIFEYVQTVYVSWDFPEDTPEEEIAKKLGERAEILNGKMRVRATEVISEGLEYLFLNNFDDLMRADPRLAAVLAFVWPSLKNQK